MTPKKNIIRKPVHTLPDGSPIPKMGNFNQKENAFIYWFTSPGSEAFMNAGRAAVRAGYKPENAVIYGYQLQKKPEIAKTIKEVMENTKIDMKSQLFRIIYLSSDRMFFRITDFYRQIKKPLDKPYKKILPNGDLQDVTWEWDFEIIPLDEISERNQMCIDGITYKGRDNKPFYILPDRDKAAETFFKCAAILMGKKIKRSIINIMADVLYNGFAPVEDDETHWKNMAEILRGDIRPPFIVSRDGKAPENAV